MTPLARSEWTRPTSLAALLLLTAAPILGFVIAASAVLGGLLWLVGRMRGFW